MKRIALTIHMPFLALVLIFAISIFVVIAYLSFHFILCTLCFLQDFTSPSWYYFVSFYSPSIFRCSSNIRKHSAVSNISASNWWYYSALSAGYSQVMGGWEDIFLFSWPLHDLYSVLYEWLQGILQCDIGQWFSEYKHFSAVDLGRYIGQRTFCFTAWIPAPTTTTHKGTWWVWPILIIFAW